MITTFHNIRFVVPNETPIECLLEIAKVVQDYDSVTLYDMMWNPTNHILVPRGRTFIAGRYPSGRNMDVFLDSIRAWFESTPHITLDTVSSRAHTGGDPE